MRYLYFYIIVFILILFQQNLLKAQIDSVSQQQPDSTLFDFEGRSVYKIVVKNISKPISLRFHYQSSYPPPYFEKKMTIDTEGEYFVGQYMVKPEVVIVAINNDKFRFYAYPNDTLTVFINNPDKPLNNNIDFEGKTAAISYYYYHKSKSVIKSAESKKELLKLDPYDYSAKRDGILKTQLNFLENYPEKNSFPKWFLETEKWDIIYSNAQQKLGIILLKQMEQELYAVENEYFEFLKEIPINNHEAIYSNAYFNFLDDYFNLQVPDSVLRKKKGTYRALKLYEKTSPLADAELTGHIRDMYMTRELAALIDRTSIGFLAIDEFIADNESKFVNAQLWEFLIGMRKLLKFKEDPRRNNKALRLGEFAPNFRLEDIHGDFYTMEDFFGYVTYLHFWSLKSKPSIQALSQFKGFDEKIAGKRIQIVHICFGSDIEKWKNLVKEQELGGINLISLYNEKDFKEMYKIIGTPHYAIINSKNRLYKNEVEGPQNIIDKLMLIFNRNVLPENN